MWWSIAAYVLPERNASGALEASLQDNIKGPTGLATVGRVNAHLLDSTAATSAHIVVVHYDRAEAELQGCRTFSRSPLSDSADVGYRTGRMADHMTEALAAGMNLIDSDR